ncbi:ImmA/IrrE family metallo-endopeptidase [Pseudomonas syringae pv. syringae]|nr:ImmA/IrrE family metallo-endopeptidase [Pseudomonas syringae pv. syringae]
MIPNKVKVAGIEYEIYQVEEIDDDPGNMGSCIYQKSFIKLKESMSEHKKEQTFIHEVLHACFNEAGFQKQDEDMVNRLGIVLHQVLKDNKLYFGDKHD